MNLFRMSLLIAALIAMAGCEFLEPPKRTVAPDQCMRARLFDSCMQILPAGPVATQYNDWAEVVDECQDVAYYHSLRSIKHIDPVCLAE